VVRGRIRCRGIERIYIAIHCWGVAGGIEFDWDDENKTHLAAHKVAPAEFEQLLNNEPVDITAFPASASDKKAFRERSK
jgi:hypothetical protein